MSKSRSRSRSRSRTKKTAPAPAPAKKGGSGNPASKRLNNVYFFLLSDDGAIECWGNNGSDGHWEWGRGTGPICDQKQEKKWPGATGASATGSSYSSPSTLSNSSVMSAPLPDSPADGQGVSPVLTGNAVVWWFQGPHGEGSTFSSNLLRSSMNPTIKHCILITHGLDKQNWDFIDWTGVSFHYVCISKDGARTFFYLI